MIGRVAKDRNTTSSFLAVIKKKIEDKICNLVYYWLYYNEFNQAEHDKPDQIRIEIYPNMRLADKTEFDLIWGVFNQFVYPKNVYQKDYHVLESIDRIDSDKNYLEKLHAVYSIRMSIL